MSKKLQGNGLFESSRMMLFEHRDALVARGQREKRMMPVIHEDEWEVYFRMISESYYSKKKIIVSVFDEYEDVEYVGVVERIDQHMNRIRLGNVWMVFAQIVGVRDVVEG